MRETLAGVDVDYAVARPVPSAHTIWELVLHIDVYVQAALSAVGGSPMPQVYGTDLDWPQVPEATAAAWTAATNGLFRNAERLAHAIEASTDATLQNIVPGHDYDFYHLLHGIVQHSLYHTGQIALLKKAVERS